MNALYSEAKEQVEQAKSDERELEELRELKQDIERKEKQQASIIEHQVRLESVPAAAACAGTACRWQLGCGVPVSFPGCGFRWYP